MSVRVTATEVKEIIEVDAATTDALIDVFIVSASILVDKVEADGGITDATHLKEIERWVSAHLVAIRDKRVSSEGVKGVTQSFQYALGLNFNVTMYGQQALLLDTSGTLAALQKQTKEGSKIVSLTAMGPWDGEDY